MPIQPEDPFNPLHASIEFNDALSALADRLKEIEINLLKQLVEHTNNRITRLTSPTNVRLSEGDLRHSVECIYAVEEANRLCMTFCGRLPVNETTFFLNWMKKLEESPNKENPLEPVSHLITSFISAHQKEWDEIKNRLIQEKNKHTDPTGCNPIGWAARMFRGKGHDRS